MQHQELKLDSNKANLTVEGHRLYNLPVPSMPSWRPCTNLCFFLLEINYRQIKSSHLIKVKQRGLKTVLCLTPQLQWRCPRDKCTIVLAWSLSYINSPQLLPAHERGTLWIAFLSNMLCLLTWNALQASKTTEKYWNTFVHI